MLACKKKIFNKFFVFSVVFLIFSFCCHAEEIIATVAKHDKTNNKRLRNALDAQQKATMLNIPSLLPATRISQEDAAYAALATSFAINTLLKH